jgi:hypothetical protein
MLDVKNTGFITFPEFIKGIDKIILLSNTVKERIFARMDYQGIGLIDYESFL